MLREAGWELFILLFRHSMENERNPSSVTTATINTTSGHFCRSALSGYNEESQVQVNEMAKYILRKK